MDFYRTALDEAIKSQSPEMEQYAVLAAWIISYLRSRFDREEEAWLSRAGSYGRAVRNTCEAVEALHLYRPDSHAAQLVDTAVSWLINLPPRDTMEPDVRDRFVTHPGRFKTLVTIDRFKAPPIRRAFTRMLREHQYEDGMDDIDTAQYLKMCVLLDALQRLSRHDQETFNTPSRAQHLTRLLRRRLQAWHLDHQELNARDLSYMAALLVKARAVRMTDAPVKEVIRSLNASISKHDNQDGTDTTHLLYAALQLATYFRAAGDTNYNLKDYLRDLIHQYLYTDYLREKEVFDHALLLRVLNAYYGPSFEDFRLRVISCMIQRGEVADRHEHQSTKAELSKVIHSRLEVAIEDVDELSGGYTNDQVYKVTFAYGLQLGEEDGEGSHGIRKDSAVIKKSTEDAFLSATQNYQRLSEEARTLFAKHPGNPQVIDSGQTMSYFLMLEDLTNLMPFARLFGRRIDLPELNPRSRILLDHSTENMCNTLFTLFESAMLPSSSFPGLQLARLYFSRIEEKLTQAFMHASTSPDGSGSKGSIDLNEYDPGFAALKACLGILNQHGDRLQPAMLGLVHGDFHSRNIMVDKDAHQVKLIDMDKLSWSGDYIADLGLLLMDIALYRRLSERGQDHSLLARDISTGPDIQIDSDLALPSVVYPSPSPATQLFQERLIEQISVWAYTHSDSSWQERLWLAVATAMLARVRYQANAQFAGLLYVEGIRLLHELAAHLATGELLPAMPFRDVSAGSGQITSSAPAWCREYESVRRTHQMLGGLVQGTRLVGRTVEYYVARDDARPALFATLSPHRNGNRGQFAELSVRVAPSQLEAAISLPKWAQMRSSNGNGTAPSGTSSEDVTIPIGEGMVPSEMSALLEAARAIFDVAGAGTEFAAKNGD